MSAMFTSLLPFLAALQRKQSMSPDDDDSDALGFIPALSQNNPQSPAPQPQEDQSQQNPLEQNNAPLLMQLLQSGVQSSDPNQAQTASASGAGAPSSFPEVETPSAEDIENGSYIIEGRRHLLVNGPGQIGLHDYTKIPVIENGKVARDQDGNIVYERWGVLGNPGSDKNQQVRDDPRNDQFKGREGSEVWVKVTPEQREALRQGMQYFAQTDESGNFIHPCPVCGTRYGRYDRNSNTFQYNMRFWNPAGPIPSQKGPFWTLGEWKNEPNEQWYQPQEPK